MILAIDIGNTDVVFGLFSDKLEKTYRIPTVKENSKPYYHQELLNLFANYSFSDILLVSVVPDLTVIFEHLFLKLFNLKIKVFKNSLKLGINIAIDNQEKLGSDLLLGVYAARELYGLPLLVFDLGTASTLVTLDQTSTYRGGLIVPGLFSSFNSLVEKATLLKGYELTNSDLSLFPKNTRSALNSGLFHFTCGGLNYYTDLVKEELGGDLKVIVTGGAARLYESYFKEHYLYEPDLLLKGLYLIYQNNLF